MEIKTNHKIPGQLKRIQPRYVIFISIVLLLTMFLSAFFELNQTRREIRNLMEEEASTLMSSITRSGANAIYAYHELEKLIEEKLLSVARLVDRLERNNNLTQQILTDIAAESDLYRINILNQSGQKILSSFQAEHSSDTAPAGDIQYLAPIFAGQQDEIIIGIRENRHQGDQQFAVAVRRSKGGAIVANVDARSIVEFRRSMGVGRLMQDIGEYESIAYIVLQDSAGILLATEGVSKINALLSDHFLLDAFKQSGISSRFREYKNSRVFEFVKPFILYDEPVGLFRIGLKTDHLEQAASRIKRRLFIMSLVMGLFILIAVNFLTINQNYRLINEAYRRIKTYSGNILEHMTDAVIAINSEKRITLFNTAAAKIFQVSPSNVINESCEQRLHTTITPLLDALDRGATVTDLEKPLHINDKYLITSISTSVLRNDSGKIDSAFAVIKDLTEKRHLEETLQRKEKLTAMGQLASGVAHEIRNPLNAISMITQRLNKEFEPGKDSEEYHELTRTVVSEVKRINEIIRQFLTFARPPKPDLVTTDLNRLIQSVISVVKSQAMDKEIKISAELNAIPKLAVDQNQMKQALLNLFQNSIDAIHKKGEIIVRSYHTENMVVLELSDNGSGISEDERSKIFNLYFTTKPSGTGLGLSLVHQIISQHNGNIELQSEPGKGTLFTVQLPVL
ncbi:PAS domain-containing protein [candidate division KSB1 bacterium]|nr:PAS domain-containing protein [candidate division KSB1 bacterium]